MILRSLLIVATPYHDLDRKSVDNDFECGNVAVERGARMKRRVFVKIRMYVYTDVNT